MKLETYSSAEQLLLIGAQTAKDHLRASQFLPQVEAWICPQGLLLTIGVKVQLDVHQFPTVDLVEDLQALHVITGLPCHPRHHSEHDWIQVQELDPEDHLLECPGWAPHSPPSV